MGFVLRHLIMGRAGDIPNNMATPKWLNDWPRMGSGILMGTGIHCIGCGKFMGITTIAITDDYIEPEREPDYPFSMDDCPVCCEKEFSAVQLTVEELSKYPIGMLR